jgi:2-haloacid dehalogenase
MDTRVKPAYDAASLAENPGRAIASRVAHPEREKTMTIKAVVFDAYGTLYDIQSVAAITGRAYPGYGELITQIWRIKQLEYTWLRSLMRRYEDFSVITRESLGYTLDCLGLKHDAAVFDEIMDKYVHLDPYPDALQALGQLQTLGQLNRCKLAILSNGSTDMLNALVRNTGLDRLLDATISVDSKRLFKPSPEAYTLIEATLGVKSHDVLFVSSNPFDVCGAKAFGLRVAWIERVTPQAMAGAFERQDLVTPLAMFKAIRTQMDQFGLEPDHRIRALSDLPELVATI